MEIRSMVAALIQEDKQSGQQTGGNDDGKGLFS